jgi:G:T-mismatch repair DNA endonuclease (very short patch repair protein)
MDHLTASTAVWNMSRIRGRDTRPERMVSVSMLHRLGFRFRLHSSLLPGHPDVVLPKYRSVVFVHGCFWPSATTLQVLPIHPSRGPISGPASSQRMLHAIVARRICFGRPAGRW